jgi:fructose-1,6-bisphosphatase/inositol monophosphatase family enzyme
VAAADAQAYDICAVIPIVEGVGGSVCHTGKQHCVFINRGSAAVLATHAGIVFVSCGPDLIR